MIGFSDIQAEIASELIRHGIEVWISNHRSVDGILDYVRRLGALVGAGDKANAYADELRRGLDAIEGEAAALPRRPKVYFEEWDEPPITGIRWVAELIRIAGGDDVFPERAAESLAKHRILEDADEVVRRAPDIILGSWCGKKFRPEKVAARPGWNAIPAVRDRRTARDQVADHPAARSGRADRRRRRDCRDHSPVGVAQLKSFMEAEQLRPCSAGLSVDRTRG